MILQATDIHKSFTEGDRRLEVLRGVDMHAAAGEWVAILGRSGSGKSTLLNLLAGLDRPDSGQVILEGQTLGSLSRGKMDTLRARRIGLVFQAYHLLPELTALENVALASLVAGRGKQHARATEVLTQVGLEGRIHHLPNQLSGGERQRVAIARALVNQPAVVLADEPTGNLDATTRNDVLSVFKQLKADGQTLVMVTHDSDVAACADRVVTLVGGQTQAEAPA